MLKNLQTEPTAILVSGVGLAGSWEFGLLDQLPKGTLIGVILSMFGIILFFAKRDWNKVQADIKAAKDAQAATEKKLDAFIAELGKKMDANHNEALKLIGDCVNYKANSVSFNRIFNRINKLDRRAVRLETMANLLKDGISNEDDAEEKDEKDEAKEEA